MLHITSNDVINPEFLFHCYFSGGGLLLGVIAMALVPVWPGEAQIAFQYITNGSGVIVGIFFALLIG